MPASPRLRAAPPAFLLAAILLASSWLASWPAAAAGRTGAAGTAAGADWAARDRDGNGVEDVLDAWAAGAATWAQLRAASSADGEDDAAKAGAWPAGVTPPGPGPLALGELRLLRLGGDEAALAGAEAGAAEAGGALRRLHALRRFGGVEVLAADEAGLAALLAAGGNGRLMLDRDGRPALDRSSRLCGALLARQGTWLLEGDWVASVAILDSGCDTAHDDLGDFSHDNRDGPPPSVGDVLDWSPASAGWPLFLGYKVIGWRDVTDDFPEAAGPWDYHYHGTALAGVVAGAGKVNSAYRGLAPVGRLTVVKFYDFDGVWRQWAGDFLAACDWLLENRDVQRVRVALCAVHWDVDAGLSDAVDALTAAGILLVTAAGNGGADQRMGWPALHPDALTVGAVDDAARVAAFSNRGPAGSGKPDLVAPGGGGTPSEGRITAPDNEPNDTYSERYGTSLAAAHVAAGAALIGEALRKEGWPLPAGLAGPRFVAALLRGTAAPVPAAETAAGGPAVALPLPGSDPDTLQGRGLLQIAAAVEAALQPLAPGSAVTDSLGGTNGRRVLARRLAALPGVAYRLEAEPAAGLDVSLEMVDARRLTDPESGLQPAYANRVGSGGLESLSWRAATNDLAFVTVKLAGGSGNVTLRLVAEPAVGSAGFVKTLGGQVTGWVNGASFGASGLPTLVCTSLADVDPQIRQVHALDLTGRERAGWPVSIFLPGGSSGQLTAPLAWDLTAQPGDELVVTSTYGRIYFLTGTGGITSVDPGLGGSALTAAVGRATAAGAREVATVSASGQLLRYTGAGALLGSTPLGLTNPRTPASGQLDGAAGEELAIVDATGLLTATGEGGAVLAGWPVDLGATGLASPVLADLDGDGRHEIVTAHLAADGGRSVVFRVRRGDGSAGPGDGVAVAAPDGGSWRQVSGLAVAPQAGGGALRVVLQGLAAAGSAPDSVRWRLALVSLTGAGGEIDFQDGCEIRGLTPAGTLQLSWSQLAPPLVWNYTGAAAAEPEALASLGWQEVVSGNPNLLGAFVAWLRPRPARVGAARLSLWPAGPLAVTPVVVSGALILTAGDAGPLRVTQQGARLAAQPGADLPMTGPFWASWRGDGRNSAAWPLAGPGPTAVPAPAATPAPRLALAPNPTTGGLRVAWRGAAPGAARLTVFDVRGRRVRRLSIPSLAAEGALTWDGRTDGGAPVATGLYFFVLEHRGGEQRGRAVVSR